jgi:hypothetical protein
MTCPFRSCVILCIAIVLLFASAGPVSADSVPQVTGLSPAGGPIAGGTIVTITGSGFSGATDVQFGGKSGIALKIVNDSQLTIITPPDTQGTVPVSVIGAGGVGSFPGPSIMVQYEYDEFPPPRISGISPTSGSPEGATLVTLTGSGFSDTEYVRFGDIYGVALNVIDDNHLTVWTQRSAPGSVPVSVKNHAGVTSSHDPAVMYLYEFPLPKLTNVSPSSGSTGGGTLVTITGSGFSGATDIRFGGISGTNLNIVNDSCLTIITPPDSFGTVAISVINPARAGGSLESATMFHYEIPVPKLISISPSSGSTSGGTLVTIAGSWLNGTKDVRFGGKSGTALNVIDDNHLTIITPASSPGSVPISITNAAGTGGSLGPSTVFRYGFPQPNTTTTKITTPDQGHATGEVVSPTGSPTVVSQPPTAPTATITGPQRRIAPGFVFVLALVAIAAIIVVRRRS